MVILLTRTLVGAIHSTKISGNFGPKLNGSVWSNRKSFEKTGPPFEVDHFSRSDRLEFWLNGSRPVFPQMGTKSLFHVNSWRLGDLCPYLWLTWRTIHFGKMAESGNFSDQEKALEYVKSLIRPFPDFPQPGILFRWDFSLQIGLVY